MSDTMHSGAEQRWEAENADAERGYMLTQQARVEPILATFAAGAHETQIRAVLDITLEVERHAHAIDPREGTAVDVLVDLVEMLAQAQRHTANVLLALLGSGVTR